MDFDFDFVVSGKPLKGKLFSIAIEVVYKQVTKALCTFSAHNSPTSTFIRSIRSRHTILFFAHSHVSLYSMPFLCLLCSELFCSHQLLYHILFICKVLGCNTSIMSLSQIRNFSFLLLELIYFCLI